MEEKHRWLTEKCEILSAVDDSIASKYSSLTIDYNGSEIDYDSLYNIYMELLNAYYELLRYDIVVTENTSQMILPAQYMVFAETVRRYYYEDFYVKDTWSRGNKSGYWAERRRFYRDIVLHSSQSYSGILSDSYWFLEVSNALEDYLIYGNRTEFLAWDIFYNTYYDWLPYWCATGSGNALNDINVVVQWCIDKINYESDAKIILGQEPYSGDYAKFPVETAFRTMGDCEDQAILCAAYLESRGYETALAGVHDAENPNFEGVFQHAVLLVHVEDTISYHKLYSADLWNLGDMDPYEGRTWCWLDPTWNVPFGTEPGWLKYYRDKWITNDMYDNVIIAICDLNGAIIYTQ